MGEPEDDKIKIVSGGKVAIVRREDYSPEMLKHIFAVKNIAVIFICERDEIPEIWGAGCA